MATKAIMKSRSKSFTMDALYTIASSIVTALLFTAGWSVAVGRRLQTIDDLKSGFGRIEGDIKKMEESMTTLIDRISNLEGKVDGIAMTISSTPGRKQG
jgi:hypothetical protein